jgi:hypothetical protein
MTGGEKAVKMKIREKRRDEKVEKEEIRNAYTISVG